MQLTYAGGVLIKAKGWSDIYGSLPWLVGSLGTVVFDFIIVVQCVIYRNKVFSTTLPAHALSHTHTTVLLPE